MPTEEYVHLNLFPPMVSFLISDITLQNQKTLDMSPAILTASQAGRVCGVPASPFQLPCSDPWQVRLCLLCVGTSLVFGPVLGKSWRLYKVFTQRVPDKRVVSTQHPRLSMEGKHQQVPNQCGIADKTGT